MIALTSEKLEGETTVHAPISDFVLDKESWGSTYQYRLRVDGREDKEEWRSSDAPILRIQKANIQ